MNFSYCTIYVRDIKKMISFYEKAFSIKTKFIHESGTYAEMDTDSTILSFAQTELAESIIPTGYVKSSLKQKPANMQIGFEPRDVKAALKQALSLGAVLVSDYQIKPWGWESAIIRDIEGNIVELARKCE
jgi:lactoylglutathione lyase